MELDQIKYYNQIVIYTQEVGEIKLSTVLGMY